MSDVLSMPIKIYMMQWHDNYSIADLLCVCCSSALAAVSPCVWSVMRDISLTHSSSQSLLACVHHLHILPYMAAVNDAHFLRIDSDTTVNTIIPVCAITHGVPITAVKTAFPQPGLFAFFTCFYVEQMHFFKECCLSSTTFQPLINIDILTW